MLPWDVQFHLALGLQQVPILAQLTALMPLVYQGSVKKLLPELLWYSVLRGSSNCGILSYDGLCLLSVAAICPGHGCVHGFEVQEC